MKKKISVLILAMSVILLCLYFYETNTGRSNLVYAPTEPETESSHTAAPTFPQEETSPTEAAKQETPKKSADEHTIPDFEIIYQEPELPTGCEITAATMALNYYGLNPDKVEMATHYLPREYFYFYYNENGIYIGPDLYNVFLGDPTTLENGTVCGPGAIVTAANDFLKDSKSKLRAKDITGSSAKKLYSLVKQDVPVIVWITVYMNGRGDIQSWQTENGNTVDWGLNDHCGVLIGYTEDTVIIADPIQGKVEYTKEQFETTFEQRNNQCVIIK